MTIRILVADDHCMVREGLCSLIDGCPAYTVAGQAETGLEAAKLTRRLCPDIVIMDIGMPDLNGIDATRMCIESLPKVKVIALSVHTERHYVLGMIKAGAKGYLLKQSAFQELVQAIKAVINNHFYLSPCVAETVVDQVFSKKQPELLSAWDTLTGKEREVLQMIAEGRPTRGIAEMLNVSVKTVEARRTAVMRKLNLSGTAELTRYAIREGLTSIWN